MIECRRAYSPLSDASERDSYPASEGVTMSVGVTTGGAVVVVVTNVELTLPGLRSTTDPLGGMVNTPLTYTTGAA